MQPFWLHMWDLPGIIICKATFTLSQSGQVVVCCIIAVSIMADVSLRKNTTVYRQRCGVAVTAAYFLSLTSPMVLIAARLIIPYHSSPFDPPAHEWWISGARPDVDTRRVQLMWIGLATQGLDWRTIYTHVCSVRPADVKGLDNTQQSCDRKGI